MDNRNKGNAENKRLTSEQLFNAAEVKRKVNDALKTWSDSMDFTLKTLENRQDEQRLRKEYLNQYQSLQREFNPKGQSGLSKSAISHSSVWLPVCVNYPTQEYSKQEYLDLMLYAASLYGVNNVEMSLFPNRYLKAENGSLYSEAESIAISLKKWNEEEPKEVTIDENGLVQIKDSKYIKLAGRITDSARCLPEDYEAVKEQLRAACTPSDEKYKKDLHDQLKRDLKSTDTVMKKFGLTEDAKTNERLSTEHIMRETAFLLSKTMKQSKEIEIPKFHVLLVMSPHDLFYLMNQVITKAFYFDRQAYSMADVQFKRPPKNRAVKQNAGAQLLESSKTQLPESQNAQLLEPQAGPEFSNKKSKSNPNLTPSTLLSEVTNQKNDRPAAEDGGVFDTSHECEIVERPRGKSAPVVSVSNASTGKKENSLRQSSESSSDSSASSTANSSSSAPSSLAGTPKVSPPLPGKFPVADNAVPAVSSSKAMPISKNQGEKGVRKEIKGSSKPGFFVAPRQEGVIKNLRTSDPNDAHLKARLHDTSEDSSSSSSLSSSPSSSPSGFSDGVIQLGRQGSGKTHLQMGSDAQGLDTPPKTPSPRKKSPDASKNISIMYSTASQTKAVMTQQGQFALSSSSQTHFNATQQVATTHSVDQGAVDKQNQPQQAYQKAVISLGGFFGQSMGGLIKEVVAGGLVNEKGSPAEQLTLGVASVFSADIVKAAVNQINQGLQINPGLN